LTYKLCQIAEQLVIGCISLLLLLLFSLRQPLVFGAFVVAFAPFYPPRFCCCCCYCERLCPPGKNPKPKNKTVKVRRQEVRKGAEQSGIIIKSQLPVKQPPTLRPSP